MDTRRDRDTYRVGIICALAIEKAAAVAILDQRHERLPPAPGDVNDYAFGTIGAHDVVIACLPAGVTGTVSAAVVAQDMMRSFPIRVGLMVGVAGGVWSEEVDVRLGDVVVSQPNGQHGGVVQWDFGKMEAGGRFRRTSTLNKPPRELLSALQGLRIEHELREHNLEEHLAKMLSKYPTLEGRGYVHQGLDNDELFEASYNHELGSTCVSCDRSRVLKRTSRKDNRPEIHYGNIASGDEVIKDGLTRDRIAQQEGVIAFEMEAAGLMDSFPCVVIRGVCDYADSHKNKHWQRYAAATAAAYARELLSFMSVVEVAQIRPALEANGQSRTISLNAAIDTDTMAQFCRALCTSRSQRIINFVGRQGILETLQRKIYTARDCQNLAVVGLGGIGKTQVVLSFAYAVMEEQQDVSIFWVPALSFETFNRAMEEIAGHLGLRRKSGGSEDVKVIIKSYLSTSQAGKWLLIVDNADDKDLIDTLLQFLPNSPSGTTIFTTRTSIVAQQLAGSNTIKLQNLSSEEAKQLLTQSLNRKELMQTTETAADLLKEMDHLPLAITQAAAFININPNIYITDYLRLIRSTDENKTYLLSNEIRDSSRYQQSSSAVARTWIVSFVQIEQQDRVAADLLYYMSCIQWKDIPHSILPAEPSEARMLKAIGMLCSYSFITRRADSMAYDMHRLVHLATRLWLQQSGRMAEMNDKVIANLARIFPSSDYENRMIWRSYMSHFIQLQRCPVGEATTTDAALKVLLYYKAGCCLLIDGRARDAVKWLQLAYDLGSRFRDDDPDQFSSQYALVQAKLDDGQVKEAVHLLEHIVAIQKISLPAEDHPHRLISQHSLARAYLNDGQVKKAIHLLEYVVMIRKISLDESHPSRLASQHVLAQAYLKNKQVNEAINLLEHVVMIRKISLDESHPSRLASQHVLAQAYRENAQIDAAISLLEHVVAIGKVSLAADHPDRIMSQRILQLMYEESRQMEDDDIPGTGIRRGDHNAGLSKAARQTDSEAEHARHSFKRRKCLPKLTPVQH